MLSGTLTSGRKWEAYAGFPDVDVYGVNAYRHSAYPKMEWLPAYCVNLTESELAEIEAITKKVNAASKRGRDEGALYGKAWIDSLDDSELAEWAKLDYPGFLNNLEETDAPEFGGRAGFEASHGGWENEEEWWEFISEAAVFAAWDQLQERLDMAGVTR